MMEMTAEHYHPASSVKSNLERKDKVEVTDRKSYSKTIPEEKGVRSVEREVMVERVSSTTELTLQRATEKQRQGTETCRSTETMLKAKILSKKLSQEKKDRHSKTPNTEDLRHRSHKSKERSSSSSSGGKSFKREHSSSESTSKRIKGPQEYASTTKHSEREAKGVEPEVSSSFMVLGPHRRGIPPPPKIYSSSGHNNKEPNRSPRKERERSSLPSESRRSTCDKHDKYEKRSKEKHSRKRENVETQQHGRADSVAHFSGSEKSIPNDRMVELQIKKIRKNIEKMSKEGLGSEESTSKSVRSEVKGGKDQGLSDSREKQDTQVNAFLPSSRCCSPPPPPQKYWSDASETEDESDAEKHMMHVNSVNIVLNYMKSHSDKYYVKGEPASQNKDGQFVQRKRSIQSRLALMAQSDSPRREHVRKRNSFDRGRKIHSQHPANQWRADPSRQESESPPRKLYDRHSRLGSAQTELSTVLDILASLRDQQSKSPSRLSEQYEGGRSPCSSPDQREHSYRSPSHFDSEVTQSLRRRSSLSPLIYGRNRNSRLHSTNRKEDLCSSWYDQKSSRRSCSPSLGKCDSLRRKASLSPSNYKDDHLRNRDIHSPSKYRGDSVRDRKLHSPRCREDSPRDTGSRPPWYRGDSLIDKSYSPRYTGDSVRDRGDSVRDRRSQSPSYRGDSVRDRRSQSPSYRGDSVRDRRSQSPSYRGDSLIDRGHLWKDRSYSPRYRGDSLRDKESHSPRYRGDSLRDRESHSPRYQGDSVRDRGSHSPRYRGDPLKDRSYSPRYRGDPLKDRSSSPRYRGDSLRDTRSQSPPSHRTDFFRNLESYTPSRHRNSSSRERDSHTPRYRGDSSRDRGLQNESSLREKERDREFSPSVPEKSPFQTSLGLQLSHSQLRELEISHELNQRNHSMSPSCRNPPLSPEQAFSPYSQSGTRSKSGSKEKDVLARWHKDRDSIENRPFKFTNSRHTGWEESHASTTKTGRQQKKKNFENDDFFFNPAVESHDDNDLKDKKPFSEKDQMQKGAGQFTESSSSLSHRSRQGTNSSAPVAFENIVRQNSNPIESDLVIKSQHSDSNNQGNLTSRLQIQSSAGNEPTVQEQEEYLCKDSSVVSNYHQSSFVPSAHDRQLLTGLTEPNETLVTQENLPGPSGVPSATSSGRIDVDDPPYWLSDSDQEEFNNYLSEVSSLIADQEAAASDETQSTAPKAITVPIEHEPIATQIAEQKQEKESLTLNSAEMTTLLSLIQIAKEHPTTGGGLPSNLPVLLEKICKTSIISNNVSESLGGQNKEDEKDGPDTSQGRDSIQNSTKDAGNIRGTGLDGSLKKDKKSENSLGVDNGVAPSCKKDTKQLPQNKEGVTPLTKIYTKQLPQNKKSVAPSTKIDTKQLPQNKGVASSTKIDTKQLPQKKGVASSTKLDTKQLPQNKGVASSTKIDPKQLPKNKGVASSTKIDTKQLPKDKISKSSTVNFLSETKGGRKSQQNKDKLQTGADNVESAGGEKQSGVKDKSQLQQRKSELQVKKAKDKYPHEKTNVQAGKKESNTPLQKETDQEKLLKSKGDVKRTFSQKKSECKDNSRREITGKSSAIEKTFANMRQVRICVESLSASKKCAAQSIGGKPYKVKSSTSLGTKEKSLNQMGKRLLVKDDSNSHDDSKPPEAKKARDAVLSPSTSQSTHPLHRETIVLNRSVITCFACKHKLIPDEYTSMSLSTGTVTMRCKVCHTFTRMEKVIPLDFSMKTSDLQMSSPSSVTSEARKTLHASQGKQKAINKEKNATPVSTKEREKLFKLVSDKVISKSTSASKAHLASDNQKLKKVTKENKMSTSASINKGNTSRDGKEEQSDNPDFIDPKLLVFPWSSSRKRKKMNKDLKQSSDSSESDEEDVIELKCKKPNKRKRIIMSPSSSDSSDEESLPSLW